MQIGSVTLQSPFILAPLAGYTDLAFRLLCRESGASLCISEMISCHGLVYGQKNTLALLRTTAAERPVSLQLFGSDPAIMGKAATLISNAAFDIIDINMGCPVRKVIKRGAGAALMKDMDRAASIIDAVRINTTLPVTVKFRSGWNSETINAVEFAQMAEASGAAAVTVHARTWAQGFSGKVDREVITQVKAAVRIPVIGNGDILTYEDGQEMMQQTGCDAVMIGRGALGNPWVFQKQGRPDTLAERMPVILRHLELAKIHLPAERVLFRIKNHAVRYLSGLHSAGKIRVKIMDCDNLDELIALFKVAG